MKFGVIRFPGSNCDQDAYYTAKDVLGQPTEYLWHADTDLRGSDCIIVPGGFSYGDYLRCGAIAPRLPAILIHHRRLVIQQPRTEDRNHPGIRIEQRLPRPIRARIA